MSRCKFIYILYIPTLIGWVQNQTLGDLCVCVCVFHFAASLSSTSRQGEVHTGDRLTWSSASCHQRQTAE